MWETVIGIEVHAELSTKSKIFCACSAAYGGEPNTQTCPVCRGERGVLPKLNPAVAEYAVRLGLVLNCTIARSSSFDRKYYSSPDMPKGYQITQFHSPICKDGFLEIETGSGKKKIGVKQIHIEEDSGKLKHNVNSNLQSGTLLDLNRCGVPLLEIVSQSDLRSAQEAVSYLEKLRETLLYLEICDGKMQEGSFRADINLSVRKIGDEKLGVRTETKNLNSFKAIRRAIEYESARQISILENSGRIIQETRRWDDGLGVSFVMRSKENAQDYRYSPEPDLPSVIIDDEQIAKAAKNLPELALQKRERYVCDYGLSEYEAQVLTARKNICDLFEAVARESGQAKEAAHLVTGEIMRLMNNANTPPENLCVDARKLAVLVALVCGGKINRSAYKETIAEVFFNNAEPEKYIAAKGLLMSADGSAEAVKAALAENQKILSEYLAGKEKVFGFLMGQVMKKLGKGGNPELAKKALEDALKSQLS